MKTMKTNNNGLLDFLMTEFGNRQLAPSSQVGQVGQGRQLASHPNGHTQAGQDSGNEIMTPHDLACKLQKNIAFVRRLTNERTQRSSKFPVPFFKINGKAIRFERTKIQAWLQSMAGVTPTFRLPKQPQRRKRGRPRKA